PLPDLVRGGLAARLRREIRKEAEGRNSKRSRGLFLPFGFRASCFEFPAQRARCWNSPPRVASAGIHPDDATSSCHSRGELNESPRDEARVSAAALRRKQPSAGSVRLLSQSHPGTIATAMRPIMFVSGEEKGLANSPSSAEISWARSEFANL